MVRYVQRGHASRWECFFFDIYDRGSYVPFTGVRLPRNCVFWRLVGSTIFVYWSGIDVQLLYDMSMMAYKKSYNLPPLITLIITMAGDSLSDNY